MISPDQRFKPSPDVHTRSFDGETVVVDLKKGDYFGLNPLGGKLWDALAEGRSPREVAATLQGQFDVEPERLLADLVALTNELAERGLVTPA